MIRQPKPLVFLFFSSLLLKKKTKKKRKNKTKQTQKKKQQTKTNKCVVQRIPKAPSNCFFFFFFSIKNLLFTNLFHHLFFLLQLPQVQRRSRFFFGPYVNTIEMCVCVYVWWVNEIYFSVILQRPVFNRNFCLFFSFIFSNQLSPFTNVRFFFFFIHDEKPTTIRPFFLFSQFIYFLSFFILIFFSFPFLGCTFLQYNNFKITMQRFSLARADSPMRNSFQNLMRNKKRQKKKKEKQVLLKMAQYLGIFILQNSTNCLRYARTNDDRTFLRRHLPEAIHYTTYVRNIEVYIMVLVYPLVWNQLLRTKKFSSSFSAAREPGQVHNAVMARMQHDLRGAFPISFALWSTPLNVANLRHPNGLLCSRNECANFFSDR